MVSWLDACLRGSKTEKMVEQVRNSAIFIPLRNGSIMRAINSFMHLKYSQKLAEYLESKLRGCCHTIEATTLVIDECVHEWRLCVNTLIEKYNQMLKNGTLPSASLIEQVQKIIKRKVDSELKRISAEEENRTFRNRIRKYWEDQFKQYDVQINTIMQNIINSKLSEKIQNIIESFYADDIYSFDSLMEIYKRLKSGYPKIDLELNLETPGISQEAVSIIKKLSNLERPLNSPTDREIYPLKIDKDRDFESRIYKQLRIQDSVFPDNLKETPLLDKIFKAFFDSHERHWFFTNPKKIPMEIELSELDGPTLQMLGSSPAVIPENFMRTVDHVLIMSAKSLQQSIWGRYHETTKISTTLDTIVLMIQRLGRVKNIQFFKRISETNIQSCNIRNLLKMYKVIQTFLDGHKTLSITLQNFKNIIKDTIDYSERIQDEFWKDFFSRKREQSIWERFHQYHKDASLGVSSLISKTINEEKYQSYKSKLAYYLAQKPSEEFGSMAFVEFHPLSISQQAKRTRDKIIDNIIEDLERDDAASFRLRVKEFIEAQQQIPWKKCKRRIKYDTSIIPEHIIIMAEQERKKSKAAKVPIQQKKVKPVEPKIPKSEISQQRRELAMLLENLTFNVINTSDVLIEGITDTQLRILAYDFQRIKVLKQVLQNGDYLRPEAVIEISKIIPK